MNKPGPPRLNHHELDRRNFFKVGGAFVTGAAHCIACYAPCTGVCPYGVDIQANLMKAHTLLGFPQMA